MHSFRRPLIPCLLLYVAGLWVSREVLPHLGIPSGLILFPAWSAFFVWTLWRRDVTPLLLAACAATGVVRMGSLLAEEAQAAAIVRQLDTGAPRVLRGTVIRVADDDSALSSRLTLSRVSVTSGSSAVALPGFVEVLIASPEASRTTATLHFLPGETIRILAAVSRPSSIRNFHTPDHREYLALRRVYATARVRSERLVEREAAGVAPAMRIRRSLAAVRKTAHALLFRHMPAHEALLMEVLLFNDMRLLSERDERIFRDSGTMHLFAVSGSHIALLALVLIALLRSARLGVCASWTWAFVLLFLYVWLLDFVAPALRSLLMLASFVGGKWLGREVDGLSSLAFGAGLIVLLDPTAPWQAGFLLSLAGVVAILVFVPLGRDWCSHWTDPDSWKGRARGYLLDGVILTLAVALVLLPLQLFYFHQFSLVSPLANILEGALATLVLASGVAVVAAGSVFFSLGQIFGAAAAFLMRLSYLIAESAARQEWAMVRTASIPAAVVLAYYAILFSGYYLVRRDSPEFRPKSLARLTIHAAAGLLLLLGVSLAGRASRPLRIWFFDVGQGDSTLVQFPSGQTMLVDAGHVTPDFGRMVVTPELRALGIWPLDELVATHADADHIGGIPYVLRNHSVRRLVEGTNHPGNDVLIQALDAACSATAASRARVISGGEPIRLDAETTVEILNPPPLPPPNSSNNEQSVVLRIRHGTFTMLLMADAEESVEKRLLAQGIGPCDVLKVGHHGSRTSSGAAFLSAVRPSVAVISCGFRNRYGHPHPTVISRLEALPCRICRTDRDGAILIESDGRSFTVTTAKAGSERAF